MKIKQYACENLETLSIEMLSEFIHDKILPRLLFDENNTNDDDDSDKTPLQNAKNIPDYENRLKQILRPFGLTCVSPPTVYRWMLRLGF